MMREGSIPISSIRGGSPSSFTVGFSYERLSLWRKIVSASGSSFSLSMGMRSSVELVAILLTLAYLYLEAEGA